MDGFAVVPDRPGLGVDANPEVIKEHISNENRYIALFKHGWEMRDQYDD